MVFSLLDATSLRLLTTASIVKEPYGAHSKRRMLQAWADYEYSLTASFESDRTIEVPSISLASSAPRPNRKLPSIQPSRFDATRFNWNQDIAAEPAFHRGEGRWFRFLYQGAQSRNWTYWLTKARIKSLFLGFPSVSTILTLLAVTIHFGQTVSRNPFPLLLQSNHPVSRVNPFQ